MEIKIQKYRIGLVKMNKFLPIEFSTDWISGIRSQISLFFFMTQETRDEDSKKTKHLR